MRSPLLVVTVLWSAACAAGTETPAQEEVRIAAESSAAKMIIDSLNSRFMADFNAGRGEAVAAQYTEDGELMVVGAPAARGREAIAGMVAGLGSMKASITTKAVAVMANGPLAVERGEYSLMATPPGADAPFTERGTYLIHWQRVNGQWLRAADLATSPAPAPTPQ